jgi:hypothetical protein
MPDVPIEIPSLTPGHEPRDMKRPHCRHTRRRWGDYGGRIEGQHMPAQLVTVVGS